LPRSADVEHSLAAPQECSWRGAPAVGVPPFFSVTTVRCQMYRKQPLAVLLLSLGTGSAVVAGSARGEAEHVSPEVAPASAAVFGPDSNLPINREQAIQFTLNRVTRVITHYSGVWEQALTFYRVSEDGRLFAVAPALIVKNQYLDNGSVRTNSGQDTRFLPGRYVVVAWHKKGPATPALKWHLSVRCPIPSPHLRLAYSLAFDDTSEHDRDCDDAMVSFEHEPESVRMLWP
jgi:hypothetical protein